MMRTLTTVGASLALFLAAPGAKAQARGDFGHPGQLIISADRLFPLFSFTHVSQDELVPGNTGTTDTTNQTAISLLWGSLNPIPLPGNNNSGSVINPFAVPRVGIDYVVRHVTIGGDVAFFFTLGGSQDHATGAGATTSVGSPSFFVFGIAPRAGYIWPLTDVFSLWLRGGFSYYLESAKTTSGSATLTNTLNEFALDVDPQLVVTLVPHVALTASLTLDVPLTGGHARTTDTSGTSTTQSAASSILFFGINGGLLAYF